MHHVQYLMTGFLGLVFAILYTIAPAGRHELLGGMVTLCVGFIVGKWTNDKTEGGDHGTNHSEGKISRISDYVDEIRRKVGDTVRTFTTTELDFIQRTWGRTIRRRD